ncbi:Indole-3-glycerol-phosphate synthase [Desulfurobacterium thermolithotrophum DSM 11699]|uniref:Indole-3-glycerol phosphate synthase n=1 Tax=Desulfurobacterium thermolithotrophum (strain DSM 11699 / BSA) TaxID=868864 RepID=F0S211_DESTD|nr:indole-3-glycerol phosphate synthase TrpC [Desulfurobacterium thermolithotrophum]ADY74092.1 Indole-3-glycerol-phosphate synthase [Desulfurobacterium thermolithotrophum DSM 11699]
MNILQKIVEHKKVEIEEQKKKFNLSVLREEAEKMEVPYNFKEALIKKGINIIAEVKKASPSKGVIREDFDPVEIALSYEKGGAKAISVLTDKKFFQGSPFYLKQVAETVKLPVLRKDFIIDEFQIYGAKVLGASSFLLIVSILSDEQLKDFVLLGRELGMEPLIETHDEKEVERALKADAEIIGVNNRDLKTFTVSIETTLKLLPLIKGEGKVLVSESGIRGKEEIIKLRKAGVNAFLVGETLMRKENPEEVLKSWVSLEHA